MSENRRSYTEEFKVEAVKLLRESVDICVAVAYTPYTPIGSEIDVSYWLF